MPCDERGSSPRRRRPPLRSPWLRNAMPCNRRGSSPRRRRPPLRSPWLRNAMPCNKRGSSPRRRRPALRSRWLGNATPCNKRDDNRRPRPTLRGRWPRNAMPCNKRGSNRRQRRPALRGRWPRSATATNSSSSSLPAVATPRRSRASRGRTDEQQAADGEGRSRPAAPHGARQPAGHPRRHRRGAHRAGTRGRIRQRAGAVRAGRDLRPGRPVGLGDHGHARRRSAGPATSMPRLWPAASPRRRIDWRRYGDKKTSLQGGLNDDHHFRRASLGRAVALGSGRTGADVQPVGGANA